MGRAELINTAETLKRGAINNPLLQPGNKDISMNWIRNHLRSPEVIAAQAPRLGCAHFFG
jgi:hypothetical protein